MKRMAWDALTIRFRLGAALAIALVPVLALGFAQSVMAFRHDAAEQQASLLAAAERSAALARGQVETASIILETLSPETIGFQCAPRLGQLIGRVQDYANLVRFNYAGRVACAAADVGPDPGRAQWFSRLRRGERLIVTSTPGGVYSPEPAIVAAVRTERGGRFDGALAAVIRVSSLKPDLTDRDLPQGTAVALIDRDGRFLISSHQGVFAPPPAKLGPGAVFYRGKDPSGAARVFATAPLVGQEVRVLLSAPRPSLFSWARLNPLSTVLLPLIAFIVALLAVWIVAERVVVSWLHYLKRIAAIYARGRFTVRPKRTLTAPPEIRDLGDAMSAMAEAIVARDRILRENLDQKDALMREIHHRVKNNLQVITSLLNMQQRAMTDPAARAAMSDTRQRISAIALIYRTLYQGPDLKKVDLRPFLEELTAQLLAGEIHRPGIRTQLEAAELIVDPDKLAPLALFAVEAISNAQKHAFGPAGGLLKVRFALEGDEAVLEISDEGAEAPPALAEEGVGRTLMTAFARQLRGRAEVFANSAGGVTARLVFPTPGTSGAPPAPETAGNQAAA